MASQIQNSSSKSQTNWAPSQWDMYGNASQVLEGLKRKADVRVNFSPRELGGDAGRFVLDQYYAAKGETGRATVIQSICSSDNLTFNIARILPLIGMAAAVGVDYAIYGAAAEGMGSAHMPFDLNAFGIGSLIFAGALGLSEKYKNTGKTVLLYLAMFIATLGASFIAADGNTLRTHFTQSLSSAYTAGSDDEYTTVKSLENEISTIRTLIDRNTQRLEKGGNNGLNMLADGFTGNDIEANNIINENSRLQEELAKKSTDLAKARPAYEIAKRKDPLDFWGRILAALYTGAWLFAAQLMVAETIRMASTNYKESRSKIAERNRQKKFFEKFDDSDEIVSENTIRAAVEATLSRFSEILSTSKADSKYANKHDNFAKLFEEESYNKIVLAATEMVAAGIAQSGRSSKNYKNDTAKMGDLTNTLY